MLSIWFKSSETREYETMHYLHLNLLFVNTVDSALQRVLTCGASCTNVFLRTTLRKFFTLVKTLALEKLPVQRFVIKTAPIIKLAELG